MIKILLFQVLLLFNLSEQTCNGPKKNEIFWTKDVVLKWDDFQGIVPKITKDNATSRIGIWFKYTSKDKIKKVKIYCVFSKEFSWVKDRTDIGLAHEQLHFDIGEYCRRLSQRKIDSTISKDFFITENFLQNIIKETAEYHKNLQAEYDLETNHSNKTFKQIEWDEKVQAWLKETK